MIKRSDNVNPMCKDCTNITCEGTTEMVWNGCLLKNRNIMQWTPEKEKEAHKKGHMI